MDEEWFDLITPESVPGTNCDSSFPSTMLFPWSILPPRLKTDTYLLKAFSLKTACHHPTCWSLQLPTVLVAEVSKWALHNPQKAKSTKINWATSDNKLSWSIFSMLITQCSTRTLQLAKLQVRPTISKAIRSSVEGKMRVPVFNLSNSLLSWCLSLVPDIVMPFHSGSPNTCHSAQERYQQIFLKFLT